MKKTITISKVEVSIWDDDRGFRCWYKYMPSQFGDYAWGITDQKTGKGVGGFANTAEEAEQKANNAVNAVVVGKKLR